MAPSLESLDWHKFLARPALGHPAPLALEALRDKRILITGAGGSIGSALALRLAALFLRHLVLLELSESNLFTLQRSIQDSNLSINPAYCLGSVDRRDLLDEIFALHRPHIVFHAAAFKHVPLLEDHPLAAIENNVFGTQTLVSVARSYAARVVLVSTDKAVNPASVMGATKRIAEQIVHSDGGTVLRLANVLASRDSVAEVFAGQIAAGSPITVTDPAAARFFVTIDEAVNLLLSAGLALEPSAFYVPSIASPHSIIDLARFMFRELAPNREAPIQFTHPRPGEKEVEQLWSLHEKASPSHAPGLLAIDSPVGDKGLLNKSLVALRAAVDQRDLVAALGQVRSLVPEYSPTEHVLAQLASSALRVTS